MSRNLTDVATEILRLIPDDEENHQVRAEIIMIQRAAMYVEPDGQAPEWNRLAITLSKLGEPVNGWRKLVQEAFAGGTGAVPEWRLEAGTRIQLNHPIERFDDFMVLAGATGTVVEYREDEFLSIHMDELIPGAEHWDNCITWDQSEFEEGDVYLRIALKILPPRIITGKIQVGPDSPIRDSNGMSALLLYGGDDSKGKAKLLEAHPFYDEGDVIDIEPGEFEANAQSLELLLDQSLSCRHEAEANEQHAAAGQAALLGHATARGKAMTVCPEAVTRLMTDLMHLAKRSGFNTPTLFIDLVLEARETFLGEDSKT